MASAFAVIYLEKLLRKFIPKILDISVIPFVALFIMLIVNLIFIIPVSGYAFIGVSWLFTNISNNPFGAGALAMIFLLVVMLGIHQGFVPVYITLLDQRGVNVLFPILAMAGAGLVGASIATLILAPKNSPVKKQITGSLLPAFLGIGEPLIYGFALPKIIPFIAGSLGAGAGGFLMGAINT
jgi:N-acetylmuramic acid-specific PTS system IIC component